jgi:hypothetical protein
MTSATVEERRTALAIASALTLATLCVAALVHFGWAADVRAQLGFGFAGVPARPSTATSIYANNARLLAAVFAAILIAQFPLARRRRPSRRGGPRPGQRRAARHG